MDKEKTITAIKNGQCILGIEFGSTRIKAVLIGEENVPVASGSHDWENRLVNQIWTYTMEDIWSGLQACYADLKQNVRELYGETLTTLGAIGFSGMMHGYLPFDGEIRSPDRRPKSFPSCSGSIFRSVGALRICIRQS